MIVKFRLLGQPVNPVNRSEITLEVNHDQEAVVNQPKPHVGINNLYFAREDILKIMAYLNNPPGITEGAPFDIEITEKGVTETINMYLNLMEGLKRSNDGIEASVKMLDSLDHLEDKVDGFTFESMYNETGVTPFVVDGIPYNSYQEFFDKRAIFVPYVLSTNPNFRDAFMSLFSVIYCTIELTKAIKMVTQWASPMAGIGVVAAIAQLVLEVVFCIALIAAIIALIVHMFNCLIQPVKYHGAMLMIDMLKITCVKLGRKFQSSIWTAYPWNTVAYLPEKFNPIEDIPNTFTIFGVSLGGFQKTGFTNPGYATPVAHNSATSSIQKGYLNGTGGDLFRLAKKFCNGKIILPNNTTDLLLERRDFYPSATPYQLPDIRQDWNGYNTEELFANILIRFADDLNDKNCIDHIDLAGNRFYSGTILQATHSQIATVNQQLVLLKGLREIQIAAARGVAKDKLNLIEKIHKDLTTIFDAIVGAVAITAINIVILAINIVIAALNVIIAILNLMFIIINTIISVINAIVNAISSLFGGSGVGSWSGLTLIQWVPFTGFIPYQSLNLFNYTGRLDALLLENDMVSTPKLLLVDITRSEFVSPGGYSGQQRIAYLAGNNAQVINAGFLWSNFYFIDAFVGAVHNRFTKIAPATNKAGDMNPIVLSLADFKNNVSNPKIKDNFAEDVITDSIQWRIGDESGRAEILFRKEGWLSNPQSLIGAIRAQEININLQIKTSLPNGQ